MNTFKCTFDGCDKTYSARRTMLRHAKTHDGRNMVSCNLCGKVFKRKDTLATHILEVHHNDRPVIDNCIQGMYFNF